MSVQKQVRTTISLPAASLAAAKRTAKARNINLSAVVAEALDESIKQRQARERAAAAWARYQRAFAGFSEEELMLLDGVVMEKTR
jgi:post-segregation antitoxin (ccd killing protein)